jgi:hypothetical protein
MKQAIGRHDNDTARVIPVILRPVDWQKTPLGLLQALPKDGKPVRQWRDLDEAYVNITEGVRTIAENWLPQSTSGSLSEENIFAYDAFLTKEERFQLQRIQAEYANTLDETADDPDALMAYKFNISVYKKRVLGFSIIVTNIISIAITFFLTRYFFQIDYHHPQYANVWPFQGHEIWLQKQIIFGIVLGIIISLIISFEEVAISAIPLTIILIIAFIAPLLNWGFGFGNGWYLILLGLLCSSIGTTGILMCIETLDTAKKSTKQLFLEEHGLAPTQQTRPPTQGHQRTRRYSNKRV